VDGPGGAPGCGGLRVQGGGGWRGGACIRGAREWWGGGAGRGGGQEQGMGCGGGPRIGALVGPGIELTLNPKPLTLNSDPSTLVGPGIELSRLLAAKKPLLTSSKRSVNSLPAPTLEGPGNEL